jgi:hypothetical protein
MKTLEDIQVLADKEIDAIKKKKAAAASGSAEAAKGKKRTTAANATTPASKKRGEQETAVVIDLSPSNKRTAADKIDYSYILWGNSQQVQVAGVHCLVTVVASSAGQSV